MARKLLTERDVLEVVKKGSTVLEVDENTILTPSARDAVVRYGVQITEAGSQKHKASGRAGLINVTNPSNEGPSKSTPVIALGSDHGGYKLKEVLKTYLAELGYAVADVGTDSEEACDYPDFAFAVAKIVETGGAIRGIMIDGVGVASAIVANKVPGIRAVPCYDEFVARSSREHNNANVLTLGGRIVGSELAKSIVKIWLETPFGGGRHEGRVSKITDIERRYLKNE